MDEDEKYWSNLERVYVHNVYESISSKYDEFFKLSQIRYYNKNHTNNDNTDSDSNLNSPKLKKPLQLSKLKNLENHKHKNQHKHNEWPKVRQFLLQIDPYSLIADVGCGDGKYLNVNSHILSIGSDRSSSLCQLASYKTSPGTSICNKNQIIICDNLSLPFRSDLFDVVISIGVIHHLSTPKRRVRAVKELARILRPGGKIMIYVWAMEQRLRKFKCQDVLVPMLNTNTTSSKSEFKVRLRRDLSNNSAYSEDSNDESHSEKAKFCLTNESTKTSPVDETENQLNVLEQSVRTNQETNNETTQNPVENESKQINNNNTSMDPIEASKEISESTKKSNRNLVENFKRFFSQKFMSSNKEKDSDLASNKSSPNLVQKNSDNFNSIERYKQIIEDHKDLLPENFTIRQFPYSSCQDTFSEGNDTDCQTKPREKPKMLDCISTTSSSSLSPSPINQYPPNENSISNSTKTIAASEPDLTNTKTDETDPEHDANNTLNKRYYHVFRKNELDNLIKENCPNLIIYDSYYDHGNWSICARKEK